MRLERFGSYVLGKAAVTDNLGSAAFADFITTPLGGHDYQGEGVAGDRPAQIAKNFTLYAATPAALQAALDELRALRGTRDRLWARTYDDHVRFIWARLRSVEYRRTNRNFNVQPVTLVWQVANQHWRGHDHTPWTLDDGSDLDAALYLDEAGFIFPMTGSPTNLVVPHGGNRATEDVRLVVTAGGSTMTSLTITGSGIHLIFSGNVDAGDELVIDSGAQIVTNDGVASYGLLDFGANHSIEAWLRLEPGSNTLTLTRTGGGGDAQATVEFQDRWA